MQGTGANGHVTGDVNRQGMVEREKYGCYYSGETRIPSLVLVFDDGTGCTDNCPALPHPMDHTSIEESVTET